MLIIKAHSGYLDDIKKINIQSMPEQYADDFWLRCLNEGLSYVALDDDKVVGYCIGIMQNYLDIPNCGIIVSVAVDKAYRGKGIATELITKTWNAMKNRGAKACALQVRATNYSAQLLYNKLDMHQAGYIKNYYPDGEMAFIYIKFFN
jgi:ribosomal-protein-alanine N-acetyltransferase